MRGLFLVVLVGGCSRTTESAWLEGFGYGWDNANHRLSYLSVGLVDGGAQVAVVGGASTTGRAFDEDGCLSSTCAEFAFTTDDAIVDVRWASASSDQVRFGAGAVDLVVSSAGAEAMIEVPLVAKGRGEVVAFLSGLTLDTSDSLPAEAADESCYDPRHGWHPREIRVALGEPVLADDGRTVTVPVEATFAAGASGEAVRACTDAVYDLAEVAMTVSVAVAVGEGAQHAHDVQLSKVYDYNGNQFNPPEQPPPTEAEVAASFVSPTSLSGWTELHWRFYPEDPDEKGAYLRTLIFDVDRDASSAYGHATNYSPVTQLDGFEYAFTGTVVEFEAEATVERGRVQALLPAALDEDGKPIMSTL